VSSGLASFLSVSAVSVLSALGYFLLSQGSRHSRPLIFLLVSLAVGVLFGDVFFHILPELFSDPSQAFSAPWAILAGFLGFFVMEKFLRWRHCHLEAGQHYHPVVTMTLVGDAAHNFVDGLMIGAAWTLGSGVGLATSFAVFCHEVPDELGHYGVLVSGGLSPKRALFYNVLSALTAFLGLGAALLATSIVPHMAGLISAATAGGFVYIAGSDLVPELHHELEIGRSAMQLGAIVLGLLSMAAMKALLG
jgi:zinc and cadmium transporter